MACFNHESQQWKCSECGLIANLLGSSTSQISDAESQMIRSVVFKAEGTANIKERKEESGEEHAEPTFSKPPSPEVAEVVSEPEPAIQQQAQRQEIVGDHIENSGGGLWETVADISIALIVVAIAFLVYRRLFLM